MPQQDPNSLDLQNFQSRESSQEASQLNDQSQLDEQQNELHNDQLRLQQLKTFSLTMMKIQLVSPSFNMINDNPINK